MAGDVDEERLDPEIEPTDPESVETLSGGELAPPGEQALAQEPKPTAPEANEDSEVSAELAQFVNRWPRFSNWQLASLCAAVVFCTLLGVVKFSPGSAAHSADPQHAESATAEGPAPSAHDRGIEAPPALPKADVSILRNPAPAVSAAAPVPSSSAAAAAAPAHSPQVSETPRLWPSATGAPSGAPSTAWPSPLASAEPSVALPSASRSEGAADPAEKGPVENHSFSEHPCKVAGEARRLAARVDPQVPVAISKLAEHWQIGYSDGAAAVGISWAPRWTQARVVIRERSDKPIAGVQPLTQLAEEVFAVDHAEGVLPASTALDTRDGHRLVAHPQGMALTAEGLNPVLIWKYAPDGADSRPVVAPLGSDQVAVAFRRGGKVPSIVLSVLDVAKRKGEHLTPLQFAGGQVGRPDLAASTDRLLVAAAVRRDYVLDVPTQGMRGALLRPKGDGQSAQPNNWKIQLAEMRRDTRALSYTPPSRFEVSDDDAVSPRVAALDDGRWLLQWTSGPPGKREVLLVTLDRSLKALHEPLVISAKSTNAGAGQVVGGQLPASVYLVQTEDAYELWAQPLECAPEAAASDSN